MTSRPARTRDQWLSLSDDALRQACEEDFYRASGPGGQKRNKTESAVRLRHLPTGLIVVGTESRSREENRVRTLRRMREAIALRIREPASTETVDPVVASAITTGLRIGRKSDQFLPLASRLLDLFAEHRGRLSDVAAQLGTTTSALVRFFKSTDELWAQVQQIRAEFGQSPLH